MKGLTMKVEFINPFVTAAYLVLENIGCTRIERGRLEIKTSPVAGAPVNAIIGVAGEIKGQVIYSLDEATAIKMASAMMMGMPVTEFDELSKSAICEIGNMITGNAAAALSNDGFNCTVTPPSLFMGNDVVVSVKDVPILVIPLHTDFGGVTMYVALTV